MYGILGWNPALSEIFTYIYRDFETRFQDYVNMVQYCLYFIPIFIGIHVSLLNSNIIFYSILMFSCFCKLFFPAMPIEFDRARLIPRIQNEKNVMDQCLIFAIFNHF